MDINQIAQMAGVSRATVSRYFNEGYVSQEKRERIRAVVKATGYSPSQHAKSLRTGKSSTVGVIIPKINSASVSRMVAGMTPVFAERGYQVLLANTDNDAARGVAYLRLFEEKRQVDGIVLVATVFTDEHFEAMDKTNLPVVVLEQQLPGRSCVFQNDRDAMRDVTALVLRESSRPVYIGVLEEDLAAGRDRHLGFLDACADAGVEVPEHAQLVADFSVDAGYTAAERLLDEFPDTDAIVCATDSIAYGALTCLREYGRRVPEDVQVTGVGDGELSQIVTPTLTTLHHHYKTSGAEAARMLCDLLDGHDARREVRMGYEVVTRNSTR